MNDWLGLLFFVLLIIGIFVALKLLAKPQKRTTEEFERNVAEGSTMLGASMSALQGVLDPAESKAKEVRMQMKEGRYLQKRREGKANSNEDETERQSK